MDAEMTMLPGVIGLPAGCFVLALAFFLTWNKKPSARLG